MTDNDGKGGIAFDLLPTRWICTDMCSISVTNNDGKCSCCVILFGLHVLPTRWTCDCTSVC